MEDYDLLQCIDKGLESFGSSAKQTIYWQITILHGSHHNAIISNPSIFIKVLREIFGDSSVAVEKLLTSEIESVFGPFKSRCNTLENAIEAAKAQITPTDNESPRMIETL